MAEKKSRLRPEQRSRPSRKRLQSRPQSLSSLGSRGHERAPRLLFSTHVATLVFPPHQARPLHQHLGFIPPPALGALANLFQYCFKASQFFRTRVGKNFSNFGSMFAKNRGD